MSEPRGTRASASEEAGTDGAHDESSGTHGADDDPRADHDREDDAESGGDEEPVDRADRLQERLAIPVLIAALASVPAVFLTLFDDPAQTVGTVINALSGGVLVAEAVALFAVSDSRLQWLRRNWWLVALAVLIVPAVLFALAPVQLLRLLYLLRMVGALRIIRVGRILKAGRIVRERAGLDRVWQRAIGFGVSLLVAVFVAVVLSDPSSQTRQILDGAVGFAGPVPIILAGGVLATATLIVVLNRGDDEDEPGGSGSDRDTDPSTSQAQSGEADTEG